MIPSLPRPRWLQTATVTYLVAFLVFLFLPLIVVAECASWYAVLTTSYLGNAVEETRKVTKNGVQPVVTDTVKKTPGASIQLRDPGNSTLWKAP